MASREVEEAVYLNPAVEKEPSFNVPKKIVFVEALPKTPTGKILKRQMRESFKGIFR